MIDRHFSDQVFRTYNFHTQGPHLEIVDNHVDDDLGNEIFGGFDDDVHVGFHQIPDGRHLTLQLGITTATVGI